MNTTMQKVAIQLGACLLIGRPDTLYASKVEYFVSDVIACMVNVTLTLTSVLLNSVMIIAYLKSSKLKEHLSYFLITILSCVDLAVGGIGNSMFMVFLITKMNGNRNCQLVFGVSRCLLLLSGMSIAVLSSMNLERYLAMVHPLIHRAKLTKKRLLLFVIILWSLYILTLFISFAKRNIVKYMVASYRLCFTVFTIGVYVKIFLAVRKSQNFRNVGLPLERSSNVKREFLKELKLAKSYILVVMCNIICSLPQLILTSMVHDDISRPYIIDIYTTWIATIITLNSSLNSVLFFWLNHRLKKDSMTIVKQIFQKV